MLSRKIEFRAKMQGREAWVYGFPYCVSQGGFDSIQNVETLKTEYVRTDTLGQYTGKNDCTGKKIFEGDIVEFDRREWGGDGNIHVVSWDEYDAAWCWGGGTTSDMGYRKVIGNIFDNQELLKK